jgi:excisionase family DNA binding protein
VSTDTPTLESLDGKLTELLERTSEPVVTPRFLTVDGAAVYASLSTASIRRLISAGKLGAYRPCKGRVLVDKVELDSLILSATGCPRTGRGLRT